LGNGSCQRIHLAYHSGRSVSTIVRHVASEFSVEFPLSPVSG
jgi:hypothetical protein